MRARAALLRASGWAVRVEDENAFHVNGRHAIVGGKADLVAFREGQPRRGIALLGTDLLSSAGLAMSDARIEDIKTGKRREADFWQVCVYAALTPMAEGRMKDLSVSGAVVYVDGQREIAFSDIAHAKPRILARIREIAAPDEPPRTPSLRECRFCDIADCPDRARGETAATPDTEEF